VKSFSRRLGLIVLAAFAVRLVYAIAFAPGTAGAVDDAFWYQQVSLNVSDGNGFVIPLGSVQHLVPTAEHGPLYPLVLAGVRTLGVNDDVAMRSLGALFGAVSVVLVGLIGRRIAGETLGLVAAAIAAVSPLLIAADGALLSETLYTPLIALVVLTTLRLAERPTAGRAAVAGIAIGLAGLTRSEALLLLPLLALPLAWRGGPELRWRRLLAPVLCVAVVLTPWVVRNWSVFDRPLLTNNEGDVLAASNCPSTYYGNNLGSVDLLCLAPATGSEAQKASLWRRDGLGYARDHAGRLFSVVLPVRFLRTWGFYQPWRSAMERARNPRLTKAGVVFDYLLFALAVAGVAALWRRRTTLLVLLMPAVVATLAALGTYGAVRFRHAAEVPLTVLAGAGALWLAERVRERRRSGQLLVRG
jgi:4-amino-4-deoxy-L-arabinose transferase-like glycosyltransferase